MNENQNQNQETEHSEPSLAKSRNKMPLIAAAVLLVVAATAAIWAFGGSHKQQVSAQDHLNPTSIAYTAEGKVGIVRNQETFDLYVNGAKGGNREMINQIMSGSIPYAGDKNYVELANGERVYIRMEVLSITQMNGKLCVRTADGKETELDESVSGISCHSDNSVFYNKTVDGQQVQMCYQDGQITPVKEVLGEDALSVTAISKDGTLMQVAQLDENRNTTASGYYYEGQLHLLDSNQTVFQIAPIGKEVFVMQAPDSTGLVDLYRVKDLASAELEQVGTAVTEAVVYDDGSMSFVGDADIGQRAQPDWQYLPLQPCECNRREAGGQRSCHPGIADAKQGLDERERQRFDHQRNQPGFLPRYPAVGWTGSLHRRAGKSVCILGTGSNGG